MASSTIPLMLAEMPACWADSCHVPLPWCTTIGWPSGASSARCSLARACAGVSPPTSTPLTMTPFAMWSLARASKTATAATAAPSTTSRAATAMKERLRTNEGSPPQDTSIHTDGKSPASEPSRCLLPDQIGVDGREHRATRAVGLLVLAQRLQGRGLQRRDQLDELARVERVEALRRLGGRGRCRRAADV